MVLVNGVVQQANQYTGADSTLASSTTGGHTTSYLWDSHGRLTRVTDPGMNHPQS